MNTGKFLIGKYIEQCLRQEEKWLNSHQIVKKEKSPQNIDKQMEMENENSQKREKTDNRAYLLSNVKWECCLL